MERKIGEYTGQEYGPLIICIGGIHGNETAGLKAIDLILKMLEVEPITNPDFVFRGKFVAFRGNIPAIKAGRRYIHKDLNRNFNKHRLDKIHHREIPPKYIEDIEAIQLILAIKEEIKKYDAQKLVIIDLHTTSSPGGIFTIVRDDEDSLRVALEMHAPVVLGMIEGIKGTTMHYFTSENLGVVSRTITFESGQHEAASSVNVAISGIVAAMRGMGCFDEENVESQHDKILKEFSQHLPNVTKLICKHSIVEGDGFKMEPDYLNFQQVRKGEVLASDNTGPILAESNGLLLMPLYQDQGEDGFFIIERIEGL